jgi:hypothetical protein
MIIAKPVIDKKFWILQKDNEKVGNIEATAGGFQVCIENRVEQYKTIRMAAQRANIQFETSVVVKSKPSVSTVHGYPTVGRVYNPVWDVPHHLPLYTKTKKSKSWFAAGWYTVKRGRKWKVVQDPKLITLERYAFHGPFHTKESASTCIHD